MNTAGSTGSIASMTTDEHHMIVPHVLREYAVIADGERGALIGPQGDVAWMCFPSWESPAVLGGLVGGRGHYTVHPCDAWRVWGGYYEERSLIWRSRWVIRDGTILECREALARPACRDRVIVLRRIEAVHGSTRVHACLDVRAGFGRRTMTGLRADDGVWRARSGPVHLRWAGAGRAHRDQGLVLDLELSEGQAHDLVLELAVDPHHDPLDPGDLWAATEADWHDRVPGCEDTLAPRDAQLAYALRVLDVLQWEDMLEEPS
jgi:hypothetical protein